MTDINTLLGIDTGGTFTDFVALTPDQGLQVHKVLSTPAAPDQAILQGISEMGLAPAVASGEVLLIHGTTVATNATLEGKGARTVLVTNAGMGDLLTIGRQTRRELYNLTPQYQQLLTANSPVVEVKCRIDASGQVITELSEQDLNELVAAISALSPEAIAVNLLFSYLNDSHERELEDSLRSLCFVSRSSAVLPEYREYERGVVTWLNAFLGPLISRYMQSLHAAIRPSRLSIMQSSGLTIAADQAAHRAVNLLLSGPVGGISAAAYMAALQGESRLMTFDMGGTSTDVSLYAGEFRLTTEGSINDLPIAVPMVDIHTIGAGGGSIASIDPGGLLQVGPESAGADPGPACYNQGGSQATVTDANLLAGRLLPGNFLGGRLQLSRDAASTAIAGLAQQLGTDPDSTALGIIELANAHMSQALRVISIERGEDPSEFILVSFGGAGGLHICELAESLEMDRAMIPLNAGIFSAVGMLTSPPGRSLSRTLHSPLANSDDADIDRAFEELRTEAETELQQEGLDITSLQQERSADLRYLGQTFTLNLPWQGHTATATAFHRLHESRYGHQLDKPVELLNLRLRVSGSPHPLSFPQLAPGKHPEPESTTEVILSDEDKGPVRIQVPVYQRRDLPADCQLDGPLLLTEDHATSWVRPGWQLTVDILGNIQLRRS